MKSFGEYLKEGKVLESIPEYDVFVNEESESSSTTTSGVASPDAKAIKKSKFMGHDCIEVDDDTYTSLIKGKVPFKRWTGFVKDQELRDEIKAMYQKRKKLLMQNDKTGAMAYVK